MVGKKGGHFLPALEIEFRNIAHPFFILGHGPCSDADHHVVGLVVGAFQKVDIVGGDKAQIEITGDADQSASVAALLFDAVVAEFYVEVFLSEDVTVGRRCLQRLLGLSLAEGHVDLSLETSAQGDQPLSVPGEKIPVHAGFVIEALKMGGRAEFNQVSVSGVICGKEGHVERRILASVRCLLFVHRSWRDIDLATENRFDGGFFSRLIKFHGTEEVSMVRQGDGRHPEFGRFPDEPVHPDRPVQKRVFAVNMKMDKRSLGHRERLRAPLPTGKSPNTKTEALRVFFCNHQKTPKGQERIDPVDRFFPAPGEGKTCHQGGITTGGDHQGIIAIE